MMLTSTLLLQGYHFLNNEMNKQKRFEKERKERKGKERKREREGMKREKGYLQKSFQEDLKR